MSGARKWYIGVYGGEAQARTCSPFPHEVIRDVEGDTFVLSRDHNAALAREAALQQRLTAADERLDAAVHLLEAWRTWLGPDRESCDEIGKRIWDHIDAVTDIKPEEGQVNQCDGCQAGIPVVNGAHRMGKPGGYPDTMSCTASRYKP